jgi:hypothetical protein
MPVEASKSASSSSSERPIVSPVPAVFSMQSQVVRHIVEAWASAGTTRWSAASNPLPECGADVEHDGLGADCARGSTVERSVATLFS